MDLALSIFKSLLIMGGISFGVLLLFSMSAIIWVRRNSKGKVFVTFVEPNRQITTELITVDVEEYPEKIRSADGGDYILHPSKMYWQEWPPGYPQWIKEPIPSVMYVRNYAEPIDPQNRKTLITAKSLRYMTDESMLRQTWIDAREAIGETKTLGKGNIALYLSGATLIGLIVVGYLAWSALGKIEAMATVIGV